MTGINALADLAQQPSPSAPPAPVLPGLTVPAGAPHWLAYVGYIVAALSLLGFGAVLLRLVDGWFGRRKSRADVERAEVDADEVFTRVAITLVEPLRQRVEDTEARLRAANREIDAVQAKSREALAEADRAAAEAHQLRRLVQKWHRAIMDPAATLEWLRQLVGPDEPAI